MGACYACVRVVRRYVSTGRIRVPVRILVARRRKRPPAQTPAASSAAGAARARSHVDPGHGRFRGCVIETRSGGRKEPIARCAPPHIAAVARPSPTDHNAGSDHGCWTSCQEGSCLRLPFLKKKFVLVLIPVDAHCRRLLARLEYTDVGDCQRGTTGPSCAGRESDGAGLRGGDCPSCRRVPRWPSRATRAPGTSTWSSARVPLARPRYSSLGPSPGGRPDAPTYPSVDAFSYDHVQGPPRLLLNQHSRADYK